MCKILKFHCTMQHENIIIEIAYVSKFVFILLSNVSAHTSLFLKMLLKEYLLVTVL